MLSKFCFSLRFYQSLEEVIEFISLALSNPLSLWEGTGVQLSGGAGWFTHYPPQPFLCPQSFALLMLPLSSIRYYVVALYKNSSFFAIWNVVDLLMFSYAVSFYFVCCYFMRLLSLQTSLLLFSFYYLCKINVGLPGFWQAIEFCY